MDTAKNSYIILSRPSKTPPHLQYDNSHPRERIQNLEIRSITQPLHFISSPRTKFMPPLFAHSELIVASAKKRMLGVCRKSRVALSDVALYSRTDKNQVNKG